MDDDGSKSLDFDEFKKGLHDYGVEAKDEVRVTVCVSLCACIYIACVLGSKCVLHLQVYLFVSDLLEYTSMIV